MVWHDDVRIPGYRLIRPLGEGGAGVVYLAEHGESGLPVAVKLIPAHSPAGQSSTRRFFDEARLLARINHPNVITIYEVGELTDGTLFQAMEYLDGRDLGKVLTEGGALSAEEFAPFVQQICLGLHAAHETGVIHRDLKPENIVVLREQPLQVKIVDFGIAKELSGGGEVTAEHLLVGTPLFVAPERIRSDQGTVDRRTDIYALGVIVYLALSGKPPFEGETEAQLAVAALSRRAPSLLDAAVATPPEIALLVHRCLERNPAHRPPSAMAVAQAYLKALQGSQHPDIAQAIASAGGWNAFGHATVETTLPSEEHHSEPVVDPESDAPMAATAIRDLFDADAISFDTVVNRVPLDTDIIAERDTLTHSRPIGSAAPDTGLEGPPDNSARRAATGPEIDVPDQPTRLANDDQVTDAEYQGETLPRIPQQAINVVTQAETTIQPEKHCSIWSRVWGWVRGLRSRQGRQGIRRY